ncbi:hypothetical protein KS4_15750 [Poriferisphaera corsica]|uniref:Uncharacterized protein n=1 Tax=Poriferisphaera corsica TaxID=2528020 RepID=A0A517YTG8_9BACT|nr:TorF family putative porin [Poriferisphaera corsica]QDU33525.1 hypothetical protein KS4_15750 [Poriferisphaera corsica]
MFYKANPLRAVVCALPIASIGICLPTYAQNEFAEPGVIEELTATTEASSKWSFEANTHFTTEYWFRGISQGKQNVNGLIVQPSAAVTYQVNEQVSTTFGVWSSFSSQDRGGESAWYEADLTAGINFALSDTLSFDATYIWLENPAGGGEFNQELDVSLAFDDTGMWEEAGIVIPGFEGLQPYGLVAFETSSAADGIGNADGVYLEIGISPSILIIESESTPITLSVPVTFGLNLNDYYQTGSNGDGDFFGYASVGFHASMPLDDVIQMDGSWEGYCGVDYLMLSDQLRDISVAAGTGDDETRVIMSAGLSMSF